MKIGYSFWGFLTPFEKLTVTSTPDHYRGGRIDIVKEMTRRGHEVYRLQVQRDEEPYPSKSIHQADDYFPDVDLALFEWRWPTWKNHQPIGGARATEPDYVRQMKCLEHYHKKGTPIIIHDGDLQMTYSDELLFPNAVLTDACKKPRHLTRPRSFMPWVSASKKMFAPVEYAYDYTYVGNNYDRDPQFMKYYSAPSLELRQRGIQTKVWGNWLERSPERRDPVNLVQQHPNIAFGHRLSYKDIFTALNKSIAVTHITRDEYAQYGNITMRFTESYQASVVSLIPAEYTDALPIGLREFVVRNREDVVHAVTTLNQMSVNERAMIVEQQFAELKKLADPSPENHLNIIEYLVKNYNPNVRSTN